MLLGEGSQQLISLTLQERSSIVEQMSNLNNFDRSIQNKNYSPAQVKESRMMLMLKYG